MKAIRIDPNKPSHILVSLPIVGLLTLGVYEALNYTKTHWGWFKPKA